MSENNTNDMNETFEEEFFDSSVVTVPIDTTLSNSGEAADAKAVGDALALKADASSVIAITVNGEGPDLQGAILIDGTDIPMSSSDTTTLKDAVEAAAGRTGADIPINSEAGAQNIESVISDIEDRDATEIKMAAGGNTTISQKIEAMDTVAVANSSAITALQQKTGDTILLHSEETQTIAEAVEERVRSVNGTLPDATGNVQVEHALTADNLTSSEGQTNVGTFVRRTSGGSASIATGNAWLSTIRGERTHIGYVPESLTCKPTNAPREQGEEQIDTTIDRDTFVAYVSVSGTTVLTYTTSWSEDPALYGVTVTGTPKSGDIITIVYAKEDRGTIYQSAPYKFISSGWNLFDPVAGYAIAIKYDETAYFRVSGTYTSLEFSSTVEGTHSPITPDNGLFEITANGYIWVNGSSTDTEIYMAWGDWLTPGNQPAYEGYSESVIDLEGMYAEDGPLPWGLLRVADVRDEINFNTGTAVSKVERMAYNAENLATAQASGRAYEYDTNYIYLEREEPISTVIEDLDGAYDVDDHGLEYYTNTQVAVYTVAFYGNNLKNKLERDVLTKSQDLVDSLASSDATKALTAKQGGVLSGMIGNVDFIRRFTAGTESSTVKFTYQVTIPSNSFHLLIINSNALGQRAVMLIGATSGGTVSISNIELTGYTTSTTTNIMSITNGDTTTKRPIVIVDICLRGDYISVI